MEKCMNAGRVFSQNKQLHKSCKSYLFKKRTPCLFAEGFCVGERGVGRSVTRSHCSTDRCLSHPVLKPFDSLTVRQLWLPTSCPLLNTHRQPMWHGVISQNLQSFMAWTRQDYRFRLWLVLVKFTSKLYGTDRIMAWMAARNLFIERDWLT